MDASASKQSRRISANLRGLGRTLRVSLDDNLLNRSTSEEVQAMLNPQPQGTDSPASTVIV